MSTTWEMLAGDTERFALRVALLRDPDEGVSATGEEAASWGAFQLWVEGRNLCEHIEDGERTESVHWYLLPLFDWLVQNWAPLFHEERLPVRNMADDAWSILKQTECPPRALPSRQQDDWEESWYRWWSRHALWSARSGGAFPDVVLRRYRAHVEVSWGQSAVPGTKGHVSYVYPSGRSRLPPDSVATPIHTVLLGAVQELRTRLPRSSALRGLWQRVRNLESDARTEQNVAWLAGLGATTANVRSGLRRLRTAVVGGSAADRRVFLGDVGGRRLVVPGSCHAALMFGCIRPTVSRDDALGLAESIVEAYAPGSECAELRGLVRDEHVPYSRDDVWTQGYALAEEVLERLGVNSESVSWVDIDVLFKRLGIAVRDFPFSDSTIRAVSLASEEHVPSVLLNGAANRSRERRRFTLAHELCHIIYDRSYGWRLAIASGPWAPRDIERRANAFAAMLLMPSDIARRAVAMALADIGTHEGLNAVASALRTSRSATIEHFYNIGILDEAQRQYLRGRQHELDEEMGVEELA